MASVSEVVLRLVMDAEDKTAPGMAQLNGNLEKVEKRVDVGKAAILAFAGAAAGTLVGALSGAARAAADEEVGIQRLQASLAQTSDAGDRWNTAVDAMIDRAQSLAFSDDQARAGLAVLAQETGSTEEALKRLPLAMDLARAKHIDLELAAKLVGKVTDENVKVFQRMGIVVEKGASQTELLAKVQRITAGQSEGYANTTKGALDRIGIGFENLKELAGASLGPLQGVIAVLPGLSVGMSAASSAVAFLASATGRATIVHIAHAAAAAAVTVATTAWSVAQTALNLVLSANPIGIVILAIAALVAGLKFAYDHSEAFRGVVQGLFEWFTKLLSPLKGVWDMVTGFAKSLGLLGPETDKMQDDVSANFATMQANTAGSLDAFKSKLAGAEQSVDALTQKTLLLSSITAGAQVAIGSGGEHLPGAALSMGSYDEGGRVPGPVGAPQLAIVHGDEVVLTPAQQKSAGGGGGVHIGSIVINGNVDSRDRVQQVAEAVGEYFRRKGIAAGATA